MYRPCMLIFVFRSQLCSKDHAWKGRSTSIYEEWIWMLFKWDLQLFNFWLKIFCKLFEIISSDEIIAFLLGMAEFYLLMFKRTVYYVSKLQLFCIVFPKHFNRWIIKPKFSTHISFISPIQLLTFLTITPYFL